MSIDAQAQKTQRSLMANPAMVTGVYGLCHLIVDLASISTLLTAAKTGGFDAQWAALLILGYDFLAFSSQLFLGYALDRLGITGRAAALGCAFTAVGAFLAFSSPILAVVLVSLGNGLFHVGGGVVVLRLDAGRALWPGLFVAPGAIGLYLGKLAGGTAWFQPWVLALLLALGVAAGMFLQAPRREQAAPFPAVKGFALVVAALAGTVAIRSLVGFSVAYPWATGWQQALLLTLAVFLGKALGGALGDRFGWRTVTVAGLLVSSPLLAFGAGIPALALAGVLCFNLTMAITLAGLARMLPGYEGLAFGLTTTAIVVGLAPSTIPMWKPALGSPTVLLAMILASAAALWFALGRLQQAEKASISIDETGVTRDV